MRILAIDTSSKSCSVAVVERESLLSEVSSATGRTHARHLMAMIHAAMGISGLTLPDIDGFAATGGPGSFTGIRIGISTIKGLVFATGKPFVGVSTLEALAMQSAGPVGLICPVLDARKGEVYAAGYRLAGNKLKTEIEEQVSLPGKVFGALRENCIFIGDGALAYGECLKEILGGYAHFAPPGQHILRAFTVARLAAERFETNHTDDIEIFSPRYVRKSDAEWKTQSPKMPQL
ncbi:MAG: tRNA (adenosine(37)-N6)-threonylcarbamoyltransferase complex dimerization subunit type 1 TsaB [Desulfobacterales bacterium]|nr:tRNA (adenosine(37)-N6)-threonylcarbamoyltransferase complex dimerization subunit type 1 TsaB [Desulfobacterales bacterium]